MKNIPKKFGSEVLNAQIIFFFKKVLEKNFDFFKNFQDNNNRYFSKFIKNHRLFEKKNCKYFLLKNLNYNIVNIFEKSTRQEVLVK